MSEEMEVTEGQLLSQDFGVGSPPGPAEIPPPARTVETVTLEIVTLKRQAGQILMGYAIEIGRRLVEVKAMLSHGEWGSYLKNRVQYSQSTADNFMKLFREYGEAQQSLFGAEAKSQTLANLPYSKALALLALPADERESFAEEHDVGAMSTRELQAALRAKEEAEADARTAEQARAKMEADMRSANEHLAAAQTGVEAAKAAQAEAEERAAELMAQLEELEAKPVEAADPDELERARAEGRLEAERDLKEKLEAAGREKEAAVEKLKKDLKAAKEAAKKAREGGEDNSAALEAARAEAARLKKALEAASTKEVAAFQVYFDTVQKDYTGMLDCLEKMARAGDAEHHDKLVDAMRALVETLGKRVPEKLRSGMDG